MGENTENKDWMPGNLPRETGFVAPQDYFAGLNEQINASVFLEQLKSENSKNGGYSVPEGYFSHLSAAVLSKTVGEEYIMNGKTVKLWRSNVLKYASAACFLLIAGAGFYLNREYVQKPPVNHTELATEQMLYDIEEEVIIDHIESSEELSSRSSNQDSELETYILNNYSQNDIVTGL